MALEIGFYHITRGPAGAVAVRLAAKAHAQGKRMLLVGDAAALADLDKALWTSDSASFLPHGMAGTADEAEQPILLSTAVVPANGARLLLLLDTALPASLDAFDRVLNLFADGSPAHLQARADWKALLAQEDVERSYWQQTETGGWARRA